MATHWFLQRNYFPQETYNLYKYPTIVGRAPYNGIVLSHTTVSKRHCRFTVSNDGATVYVEDLDSGNGTYVNDLKIDPQKRIPLTENDQIGVALPPDFICPNLKIDEQYGFKLLRDFNEDPENKDTIDFISIKEEIILDLEDENEQAENISPINVYENEIEEEQDAEMHNIPDNINEDEIEDAPQDEDEVDFAPEADNNISPDDEDEDEQDVQNHIEQISPQQNINGDDIIKLFDKKENELRNGTSKTGEIVYIPEILPKKSTKRRSSIKIPAKETKSKRRKSGKSISPIKHKITMSQKQIRLSKLKEIADKQNEEKMKALKNSETEPKNKTVVAKVTVKNRGSFLLNDHQEPLTSTKKPMVTNKKHFDSQASLEEDLTWRKFLNWSACWSIEEFKGCKENMFLMLKNNLEMVKAYRDYDSYKKNLTNFILLEIWSNICSSYEKPKKIPEHKFKTLSNIDECTFDKCIKICIGPMSLKSLVYPRQGELLMIKFQVDGIDYTHFAIVKNIISNSNNKGVKILEVGIYWRNRFLKVKPHTVLYLKIICNISHELSMLSALYNFYNCHIRDIIISPKRADFINTLTDYPKNSRIRLMDDQQLSALRKSFAAKKLNEPTLQLINGFPGTGKTMLICWMALEYLVNFNNSNEKILICSQSNAGVDMLLKMLMNLNETHYKHLDLKIVRPGREIAMQPWAQKLSVQNLATYQSSSTRTTFDDIERDILLKADIIVTTLHWTTKLSMLKNHITWCMIDDASSAIEPEILCPLNLNMKHIILCGNMLRTPNAVISKTSLEYKFLRSSFARIVSEVCTWKADLVQILKTQHRMHPDIMQWPNKILYLNTLISNEHSMKTTFPHYKLFIIPEKKNINQATFENILISRTTWAVYELLRSSKPNASLVVLTQNVSQSLVIKKYMNIDASSANITIITFDQYVSNESESVIVAPLRNPSNKEMEASFIHAKTTLFIFFRSLQTHNKRLQELLMDAQKRNITVDIPPAFGTTIGNRDIKSDAEIMKKILTIN